MTRSDWLPIALLGGFVILADLVIIVVELTSSGPSSSSWGSSSSEPASTRSSEPVLSPRDVRAARADAGISLPRPSRPMVSPTPVATTAPAEEPSPASPPGTSVPRRPRRPSSEREMPEPNSGGPPTQ